MTIAPIVPEQENKFVRLVGDAARAVLGAASLDRDAVQRLADERGNRFQRAASIALRKLAVDHNSVAKWAQFYGDFLGLDANFASFVVPASLPGSIRRIPILSGLTPNKVVAACRRHFNVFTCEDDLDTAVVENERNPQSGPYIIRVRDRVEADDELRRLSAEAVMARHLATMTLLERLLFELKYYSETGRHLDVRNVTLCCGSRFRDGLVPSVDFSERRINILRIRPDFGAGDTRARVVLGQVLPMPAA